MLKLMDSAVSSRKVNSESEYCLKIKFPKNNLYNVRTGHQSFTIEHIINACKFTGANANWILGLEANVMRKPAKKTLDQLREVFLAVEAELGK
jgi:hypothetical protein